MGETDTSHGWLIVGGDSQPAEGELRGPWGERNPLTKTNEQLCQQYKF